jgi:cell division protein FtsL
MLAFGITINIAVLISVLILSFAAGFILRQAQLSSLRKKISELESEVLQSHAEILELQKLSKVSRKDETLHNIPVIPLKSKDDKNKNVGGQ